jgi:hypothetical protein
MFHAHIVATITPQAITIRLRCEFFVSTIFCMARPKKSKAESKSYMLRIRLSEIERQAIERASAAKSLEMSTWARSELMTLAKKIAAKE